MDDLTSYLEQIAEPTLADFKANPTSARHAFLACVATYHAIDRVTHPKKPGNMREKWRKQSIEFLIIDMVAHHLKHVRCDQEKIDDKVPKDKIPLTFIVFGRTGLDTPIPAHLDLHNLYYIVRGAIQFIREQAN